MRKQRKILTRIAAVGMALLLIGQSFLVYAEEPLDGDTSLGGGVEEGIQNTENNPEVVDSVPGSDATQDSGDDMGSDDGQNDILGTSNRVQKRYNDVPANSRQYANISALTGKDGRTASYYKDTERTYIIVTES